MSNFAPDWRWPAGMAVGAAAFLVCGSGAVLPALGAQGETSQGASRQTGFLIVAKGLSYLSPAPRQATITA
jgi:hypothetical protein